MTSADNKTVLEFCSLMLDTYNTVSISCFFDEESTQNKLQTYHKAKDKYLA